MSKIKAYTRVTNQDIQLGRLNLKMDVFIKNFEMPKDCDSCDFNNYYSYDENDCRITGEDLSRVRIGERHKKCPLVAKERMI